MTGENKPDLSFERLSVFCSLLLFFALGCRSTNSPQPSNPAANRSELIVSAAVSLKEPFNEIGQIYEDRNHMTVRFNYGASGALQKQIEAAAPADVFASAGAKQMDELAAESLINQTSRKDFVRNVLVLVIPATASEGVNSFSDLSKPQVARIAVGNPKTVPAGQYTEQTLTSMNLLPQIQPKLVFAEDVRQVLNYVLRGDVQAGIIYASDALSAGDKIKLIAQAPQESHSPIVYPIAVVKDSHEQEAAQKFVDLVLSPEGQSVLIKRGFEGVK